MKDLEFFKKVIVLNCGGTIDMNKNRTIDSNSVKGVLDNLQKLMDYFKINFEYENVFDTSPDSTNIGQVEWDTIYKKVISIIEDKQAVKNKLKQLGNYPPNHSAGGIVISHGTDTMQLTSLMLALRLSLNGLFFPIIFTGSFTTIDDENNDIENNLAKSIFAARPEWNDYNSQKLPPQIYVMIGDEIHLACRSTKVYTTQNTEGKYFFSYPFPVARITSNIKIKEIIKKYVKENSGTDLSMQNILITINFDNEYFNKLIKSNSSCEWTLAEHFIQEKKEWPIVEHIVLNRHLTKEVLQDLIVRIRDYQRFDSNKRYGVLLQGNFSKRNDFKEIKNAIQEIGDLNAIVIVGSKIVFEKLSECSNIGLIHKSLSYQKARIKLLFLLKLNLDLPKVIEFMNENISGEISEYENFPDWIQYENYVDEAEIIPIYPNIRLEVFLHAVERNLTQRKNSKIFLYGFGNGHIPTTSNSIGTLTEKFLNDTDHFDFETILEIPKTNDLDELVTTLTNVLKTNKSKIIPYLKEYFSFKQIQNPSKKIETIEDYYDEKPEIIAKRIIKDSLMKDNEILNLLGEAIDKGFRIYTKTSTQSETNHSSYPVGRTLLAIGIDSDSVEGWSIKNLTRKKFTRLTDSSQT
jgi:L-asparaginase/Glu-tRNA(Gln) amidotransferase subunit D